MHSMPSTTSGSRLDLVGDPAGSVAPTLDLDAKARECGFSHRHGHGPALSDNVGLLRLTPMQHQPREVWVEAYGKVSDPGDRCSAMGRPGPTVVAQSMKQRQVQRLSPSSLQATFAYSTPDL